MVKYLGLFMLVASPVFSSAQKKADKRLMDNLQQHISKLTAGISNRDAGQYLAYQFQSAGLSAVAHSYRQAIVTPAGKLYLPGTALYLNDSSLDAGQDFVPLPYSAQGSVAGSPLIAVQEENEPWIVDLANHLDPQPSYPDSVVSKKMYGLAQQAVTDRAKAILFYDSEGSIQLSPALPAEKNDSLSVPVVFINPAASKKYLSDPTASINIRLQVSFSLKNDTAYNVIGLIDNNAEQTIVIGAHDAEDKAALITLAHLLKQDKHYNRENYLLVAFEAARDTIGEKYFFAHLPQGLRGLQGVIDLDQQDSGDIGLILSVNGKLSPEWESILDKVKNKDVLVKQNTTSDHDAGSPGIPVLSLSSGYGDNDKSAGQLKEVKFLMDLIREMNRAAK